MRVIHNKLEWELGKQGAKIDAIYYCPHHVIDHTVEHPVKKYAIDCNCRKPKPGLIFRAAKELNINVKKSFFIGDSFRDIQAAENADLAFIGVATGYGCKDSKIPLQKKITICRDLLAAAEEIL